MNYFGATWVIPRRFGQHNDAGVSTVPSQQEEVSAVFSCLHVFFLGTPASSHSPNTCLSTIDVNVIIYGCLPLHVGPVIHWGPVQALAPPPIPQRRISCIVSWWMDGLWVWKKRKKQKPHELSDICKRSNKERRNKYDSNYSLAEMRK